MDWGKDVGEFKAFDRDRDRWLRESGVADSSSESGSMEPDSPENSDSDGWQSSVSCASD
jgi:hypothetical protein